MKDMIVQGLQQAYQNMAHMIAEFLPRLVVMLVIVLTGCAGGLRVQVCRAHDLAPDEAGSTVGGSGSFAKCCEWRRCRR